MSFFKKQEDESLNSFLRRVWMFFSVTTALMLVVSIVGSLPIVLTIVLAVLFAWSLIRVATFSAKMRRDGLA